MKRKRVAYTELMLAREELSSLPSEPDEMMPVISALMDGLSLNMEAMEILLDSTSD